MSIEKALISQSQSHMAIAKLRDIIRTEVAKGCAPDISNFQTAIEPQFYPLWEIKNTNNSKNQTSCSIEKWIQPKDFLRLQIWISPEKKLDWNQSELFLKQLQSMKLRAIFEILGNNDMILISIQAHRKDVPILIATFEGQFGLCELTPLENDSVLSKYNNVYEDPVFRDFYPPPPYSHLLTRPIELKSSPLTPLITTISSIKPPAIGFLQTIFQAVPPDNNWHRNVEILLDFEYAIKLNSGFNMPQRYTQQSPSGDLRQMAGEVESKAHNDKPFYAMALRIAAFNTNGTGESVLDSLSTFANLFQHGGRPLRYLTEMEYLNVLSREQICDMLKFGFTYRPGFLVNSLELSGFVHLPFIDINENRSTSLSLLETLPIRSPELLSGTWIGNVDFAGKIQKLCLPDNERERHTHSIGKPGTGKSTTEEHMILSDIEQGHGVAVLDPHGDLIERLLCLIPEHHIHKTIYFNPGDPDWVPIWNPLERIPGQDIGRTADDLVQAIQSFVAKKGWGDRLEHLLRNIIFSMIHLKNGSFLDISNLMRNKSNESEILRKEILKVIDNETVRQFWIHDYKKYGKDDFGPPKNKLSKLLVSDTVSLMLSQPESRFNFRTIMDEGMILLVNLSNLGSMVREILGSFILSLLHLTALSRSSLPSNERKQFHIHCDEAHRFVTDSLEDLIAETRKYNVSLSLAHQYISQFGQKKTDAISSVGSTIIFNLDSRDAGYMIKDLQKKVKVEDIVALKNFEAIARIGTEIVRFQTLRPASKPVNNFKEKIIEESHRKYYLPKNKVKKYVRCRGNRWKEPYTPLTTPRMRHIEEFEYDEFE